MNRKNMPGKGEQEDRCTDHDAQARRVAQLLRESKHATCLTGAGISTASGIPDFRSPKTGLWNKAEAKVLSKPGGYEEAQRDADKLLNLFWKIGYKLGKKLSRARPNVAHRIIASWETDLGIIKAVITQNVDGLHQKAGSSVVVELHGTAFEATCPFCRGHYSLKRLLKMYKEQGKRAPWCVACGSPLKPDVILFGEPIPRDVMERAMDLVKKTDLILLIGSSLLVYPANYLPVIVHRNGGKVVVINQYPTDLDKVAEVVHHGSITPFLKKVDKYLRQ